MADCHDFTIILVLAIALLWVWGWGIALLWGEAFAPRNDPPAEGETLTLVFVVLAWPITLPAMAVVDLFSKD